MEHQPAAFGDAVIDPKRAWAGMIRLQGLSIARHDNQLEVWIEFDLVLLSVLAFHVVNFIAVVCFLNLSACAGRSLLWSP